MPYKRCFSSARRMRRKSRGKRMLVKPAHHKLHLYGLSTQHRDASLSRGARVGAAHRRLVLGRVCLKHRPTAKYTDACEPVRRKGRTCV